MSLWQVHGLGKVHSFYEVGWSGMVRAVARSRNCSGVFKKCGISTAADGSEDNETNLTGLEQYRTLQADDFQLKEDLFDSLSEDTDADTCTSSEP